VWHVSDLHSHDRGRITGVGAVEPQHHLGIGRYLPQIRTCLPSLPRQPRIRMLRPLPLPVAAEISLPGGAHRGIRHSPGVLVVHLATSGAAYSTYTNDGSSPRRPCSTRSHITPTRAGPGVLIARVSDRSRLPAAKDTACQTWRVTTCNSSTIAKLGFHPCKAPGSAGSTANVESVCGIYSRD
jgi:hypothetical protein